MCASEAGLPFPGTQESGSSNAPLLTTCQKAQHCKVWFVLSLFPNVYLLCEFGQVSPWTCKIDFPAGLCILACIDLHSIKLQYLWFNFAKCCSDIVIWFWSKYSRHTHLFCLTEGSVACRYSSLTSIRKTRLFLTNQNIGSVKLETNGGWFMLN